MSKSYLIIDTPINCDYCPVGNDGPWCPLAPEGADIDEQNNHLKRPSWCPLLRDHEVIDKNRELRLDMAFESAWRESFYDSLVAFRDELRDLDLKLGYFTIRETYAEDSIHNCRETIGLLLDKIIEYGND